MTHVFIPAQKDYIEPAYEEFIGPGLDEIAEAGKPVRKKVFDFMKTADAVIAVMTHKSGSESTETTTTTPESPSTTSKIHHLVFE